ncbi:MAG TPA: hypothetical protein DD738_00525 [Ruminiclostridium sp.]|nr:hypothetical protein [Ruminiclostridium sp.]
MDFPAFLFPVTIRPYYECCKDIICPADALYAQRGLFLLFHEEVLHFFKECDHKMFVFFLGVNLVNRNIL